MYEPQLGEVYGPGQKILSFNIPVLETEIAGEAEWPGPGRIRAYIGAPGGAGPLSGSCFEQSYTVEAEIVEVFASAPLQPGMRLQDGDRITTDSGFGTATVALLSGGVAVGSVSLGPGSDLTLVSGAVGAPTSGSDLWVFRIVMGRRAVWLTLLLSWSRIWIASLGKGICEG